MQIVLACNLFSCIFAILSATLMQAKRKKLSAKGILCGRSLNKNLRENQIMLEMKNRWQTGYL